MGTPLLDYGNNREVVRVTRKGDRDALILPIIEGKEVSLHYLKGKLQTTGLPESALKIIESQKIPTDLYTESDSWGGFRISDMKVQFKRVGNTLIAMGVTTPKGDYHSPVTNLQLLIMRGFVTQMSLSGWLAFQDLKSPKEAESELEKRLILTNEVIRGKRPSLWGDVVKNSRERSANWSFLPTVKNLQVVDAIGFVPTVDSDKVRAVYKRVV